MFSSELISGLDFYPGNYPAGYGRKLAGIVGGRSREASSERRFGGSASLDLLDVEAALKVPLGADSELWGAFRRSHFDLFVPLVSDAGYLPRYWDYQLMGLSRLGAWRTQTLVFGSYDTLDFEDGPDSANDPGSNNQAFLTISFHRLQASAWRPVLGRGRLKVAAKLGWTQTDTGFNEFVIETRSWEAGLRSELSLQLVPDHLDLRVGAEWLGARARSDFRLPGAGAATDFPSPSDGLDAEKPLSVYDFVLTSHAPAAFVELQGRWGPLSLIPSLRADLFSYGDYQVATLDPRLVARLEATQWLSLKAGAGLFHQPPDAQALDPSLGSPASLSSPWALHLSGGAELRAFDVWELDVTAFGNRYEDLVIQSQAREQGGQVQASELWVNEGQGRSYGVEVLLRHRPQGPFFGWIAYTLARSERRRRGDDWALYAFDQTHILTAVGSLKLGSRWTVGAKFSLITGNPRTPVVGAVYDADTGAHEPVLGEPLSERNAAFHQLDVRVERLFLFDTWRLTAYLDVLNVYNRANTEFVQYSYDYSESGTVPGIPLVPSLGVKGEF